MVEDGVAYAHATVAAKGDYTKIEDSSSAQDGGQADKSDTGKPTNAPETNKPAVASIATGVKSVGEVRDETVHSSKQKITVVVSTASSQGQTQAEHSESEDEELVE